MSREFVILAHAPRRRSLGTAVLAERLDCDGRWRRQASAEAWGDVWTSVGQSKPLFFPGDGAGVVVGELHPTGSQDTAAAAVRRLSGASAARARSLSSEVWGRYVAVLVDEDGVSVFRDPSGALEAFAWRLGPTTVIASSLAELPDDLLPTDLAIDWVETARLLHDPGAAATLLAGVTAPLPGELLSPSGPKDFARTSIWRPDMALAGRSSEVASGGDLLSAVDRTVRSMAVGGPSLAELSGGLDSSVLAASIAESGAADSIRVWAHYLWADRMGDERLYAMAVADHLGLQLRCETLTLEPTRLEDFDDLAWSARPALSALGRGYDAGVAELCRQTGVERVLSGQGGDAVFYQMGSAAVLADLLLARGPAALRDPLWADLARWTRRSGWDLLAEAARAVVLRRTLDRAHPAAPYLTPVRPRPHPWSIAARGLPPGAQLQIAALANCQVYAGDNRRRRVADVVRPLMAQPVLEAALRIPSFELVAGGRDRALVRRGYAGRLPEIVLQRRSKGGLGAYYGRTAAVSADIQRQHLLDGVLAAQGLLNRTAVEAAFRRDAICLRGGGISWLALLATEAWARQWQARLGGRSGRTVDRDSARARRSSERTGP